MLQVHYLKQKIILILSNFYLKQKKNFTSQSAFTCETINKFVMNEKNEFISHNEKKIKISRTQDLKKMYLINSAAFIATKVYIKNSNRLCKKPMKYECKNILDLILMIMIIFCIFLI